MDEEQMMAALQSAAQSTGAAPDTTVGVDPVSGNEVPMGASPEEVRDDIPAQLSAGEYVVPADVVQYYGVKFFEDLRTSAKMGYDSMQQNGRVGGEPAEEMLPFDVSELQAIEEPEPEPAMMNVGGLTQQELYGLTGSTSLPNPFRVVTNDDGLSMTVRADEPVPEGFKRLDAENAADTAPESMSFTADTIEEAHAMYSALTDPMNRSITALATTAIPGPLGLLTGALSAFGLSQAAGKAQETVSDSTSTSTQRSMAVDILDGVPGILGGLDLAPKDSKGNRPAVSVEDLGGVAIGNQTASDLSAAMGDVGAFGSYGPSASSAALSGDVGGVGSAGPSAADAAASGDVGAAGDVDADAAADYGGIT